MSFYRDTVRVARKEHKCELCGGAIKVGEKYHDKAGHGDDFWQSKECEMCQTVIDEYHQTPYIDRDDGYYDEGIREWWREEKCGQCIKYKQECDEMTHYCRCEKFGEQK